MSRASEADTKPLVRFLREVDLTLSGLESSKVRLWIERSDEGEVIGSTGYEISGDRKHALIRSVAVSPSARARGKGTVLAMFAFKQAAQEGASTAWLFSRRSGPFWRRLGFRPADKHELASVLSDTHQVRLFRQTGQFECEVAWSRRLTDCVTEG